MSKLPARDPRFSTLSGAFNEDLFHKSYGFVEEARQKEMQNLKEQLRSDPDNRKIRRELDDMISQMKKEKQEQQQKKALNDLKKQEMQRVETTGKTPFYLKKSDKKKAELVEKFKELKETGKLERFMQKRVAKNARKDHRYLPYQRENK